MAVSIVIVGAGPAGFYCAEALIRKRADALIDIIDRLPTPHGLVRAGVAPDHQGTKAITRVFDRTAQKPNLRFLGNVSLGRDVSLAELQANYDAVVLAFGAPRDRRLGVPGEELPGVFGSGAFVGWYNAHPDFADMAVELGAVRSAVVIGNGNVAIDVARVLAKTPAEMEKSDLAAHAAAVIHPAPLEEIHIVGRRGPIEANFTNAELAELGRLDRCIALVDKAQLPEAVAEVDQSLRKVKEANLATLQSFAGNSPAAKPVRLRLHFWTAPVALIGDRKIEAVRLERTRMEGNHCVGTGDVFELAADLVVTCIGYQSVVPSGIPFDADRGTVRNADGRVAPGLYVVGWAKRGPSGVIATNRADSMAVADRIVAGLAPVAGKPGPAGLDSLLAARGVRPVSFADWQRIDAAEVAAGGGGRPRRKFASLTDLLAALR